MVSFKSNAKNYRDAESMAAAYLAAYFANSKIKYPLNPFKVSALSKGGFSMHTNPVIMIARC